MTNLLKTKTILKHDTKMGRDWGGSRWFISSDEESGVIRRQVYIDGTTYDDLGSPDTITITIEPGDTLN